MTIFIFESKGDSRQVSSPDTTNRSPSNVRVAQTHQLASQQWHVLNDGQSNPPLGILSQLHYSWQQRLRELPDPDHLIHTVQIRNDVQTHLRALQGKRTPLYIYL